MNEEQQQKFEAWGLLELFGHQRLAGRLTEQTIGGCHFIRITTEDVARRLAAGMRARPISAYDLPRAPALPASRDHDDFEP